MAPSVQTINSIRSIPFLALACLNAAAPLTPSSMQWVNCSSIDPEMPPALECGQVQVPLDWNNVKSEHIAIGLVRIPSSNREKLGSLIYNPGGPGGAASDVVIAQASGVQAFSEDLVSNFDIVGMDPRGVGLSPRIKCDPDLYNKRNAWFPKDETEYDAMVQANKDLWESCERLTGPLLYHADTIAVAKDLEAVRKALGDEKLNFMGASYGSQIGQTYAQLFPKNYRALALDGITDHAQSATDTFVTEVSTYERSFERFAEWCDENEDCALHGEDVQEILVRLVDEANDNPIPAPGCDDKVCRSNMNGYEILQVTQNGLHFVPVIEPLSAGWVGLAGALAQASQGNATLLSSTSLLAQSEDDPAFAGPAISCLDWISEGNSFWDLKWKMELGRTVAPVTRGVSQSYQIQAQCLGFPKKPTNPQQDMTVKNEGQPPIFLAQSKYDPSTSYVWAENVRKSIESVAFALRDGDGHTSYFLFGELSKMMDEYLIKGTLPSNHTVVKT
ncbi:uncharacterized protein HMPREF1541_07480 [Cyphellophora europaea CBS 101466]|uniref:Uncharacterized protein n=1 Tax=Cyphellophora europaea (strain CBS 101466) TaxID=1220924 RepID=W2RN29_CYPE1|nr:uncharacterized protein HMPREF1541_07480 [Cyphellophora europaea CBS 101466]ETN37857.1 hypothetical protein HMPREF1541_07480 [Cyphellophora europaea CBS 101466]